MVALPQEEAYLWRGICKIPKYQTIPDNTRWYATGYWGQFHEYHCVWRWRKFLLNYILISRQRCNCQRRLFFKQKFHKYWSWYQSFVLTSLQEFLENSALQVVWDPVTFSVSLFLPSFVGTWHLKNTTRFTKRTAHATRPRSSPCCRVLECAYKIESHTCIGKTWPLSSHIGSFCLLVEYVLTNSIVETWWPENADLPSNVWMFKYLLSQQYTVPRYMPRVTPAGFWHQMPALHPHALMFPISKCDPVSWVCFFVKSERGMSLYSSWNFTSILISHSQHPLASFQRP